MREEEGERSMSSFREMGGRVESYPVMGRRAWSSIDMSNIPIEHPLDEEQTVPSVFSASIVWRCEHEMSELGKKRCSDLLWGKRDPCRFFLFYQRHFLRLRIGGQD